MENMENNENIEKIEVTEDIEEAINTSSPEEDGFVPMNKIIINSVPVSAAGLNSRYRKTLRIRVPSVIPGRPASEVSVILPETTGLSLDSIFSSHIRIDAHIDVYSSYDPEMQRRYGVQDIVADKIEEEVPVLTSFFGKNVPGSAYKQTEVSGFFAGEVVRVVESVGGGESRWGRLTIEVPAVGANRRNSNFTLEYYKGPHSSLPPFTFAARVRDADGKIVERGDFVYVYATVSSREKDGVRFENWSVQDIRRKDDLR